MTEGMSRLSKLPSLPERRDSQISSQHFDAAGDQRQHGCAVAGGDRVYESTRQHHSWVKRGLHSFASRRPTCVSRPPNTSDKTAVQVQFQSLEAGAKLLAKTAFYRVWSRTGDRNR